MKILFDQGTPVPLRRELSHHEVATLHEKGWSELSNGELLKAAEGEFDALMTTDQNLRHQQNVAAFRLAVVVLSTTSWPRISRHIDAVHDALGKVQPGAVIEVQIERQ